VNIDRKILLIRTIGNVLVLASLVAVSYTFWPIGRAFIVQAFDNLTGKTFEAAPVASVGTQTFGSLLGKTDTNVDVLVPKDPNFSIIVEKIGADAPIIPNVDASDKAAYDAALKKGVAHALGTSFPGGKGVIYLFAHSTDSIFNVPRFNAVFYLLKDMVPGDRVVIFFQGKRYDYIVKETKITNPEDVSYFTMITDKQILVLQTCYPPGTTWKRFLVVAEPAGGQSSN